MPFQFFDSSPAQPAAHIDSLAQASTFTDFREIKGQAHVKRAMEVAAAGGHNVSLTGPPGSGKTLVARALSGILLPLTLDEALNVMNPYPCGCRGDPTHNCTCTPAMITRYQKRISGPLLDRFDTRSASKCRVSRTENSPAIDPASGARPSARGSLQRASGSGRDSKALR